VKTHHVLNWSKGQTSTLHHQIQKYVRKNHI